MPVGTIQFARRRGKAAAFRNRTMNLPHGLNPDRWRTLLRLAREEDLGPHGDVTTALLPEPLRQAEGRWELRAREAGRFCGRELLAPLSAELAPEVRLEWIAPGDDGRAVQPGETLARLSGRVCQMLAAERVLLNFLQRLSGVATLTARYVERIAGTHAKVYDTRKTLPGWRDLDKYAVRCGGGHNHRRGLYDAVLIKDNHIAGVPTGRLAHTLMDMLTRLAAQGPPPAFVEVECDDLAQVAETFKVVGIDVVYEMLKAARQHGFTRSLQADAHFLPFPSACFDVVILPETLGYIRVGRVFREVARVLTTRGRFLITTYPLHFRSHATYRKLSSAQVARALVAAGFVVRDRKFLLARQNVVREMKAEKDGALLYLMAKKSALGAVL